MRRIGTALTAALLLWGLLVPGTATAAVSTTPAATPQIGASRTSGTDGTIEVVRQLTQCGGTMYAVGRFAQVRNPGSGTPINRNNAFAFSATAPHRITGWNPNVNGQVDTVACGIDGSVLLGGSFTIAGGVRTANLAKVDAVTGASRPFAFQPSGRVAHIETVTDAAGVRHLLVGGYFPGYLRSVHPATGAADGYGMPTVSGKYSFPGVSPHGTRIWNMTVSPNGRSVLMTGVFTRVGGQRHEQVVRVDLTPGAATVNRWAPRELYEHCFRKQPFYAQDAAWAPDMSRIYVVTTGYRLDREASLPAAQRPQTRTGPCDATIAYPVTPAEFSGRLWINYTGCDSLYAVAADATTVFSGGHQRWVGNGLGCDRAGPRAVAQPGLSEVNPTDGRYQPGPNRGRGLGANDLLRTPAGLWIGSDNQANTASCSGVSNRMGICFLPG